jgi:hypothetical protein
MQIYITAYSKQNYHFMNNGVMTLDIETIKTIITKEINELEKRGTEEYKKCYDISAYRIGDIIIGLQIALARLMEYNDSNNRG